MRDFRGSCSAKAPYRASGEYLYRASEELQKMLQDITKHVGDVHIAEAYMAMRKVSLRTLRTRFSKSLYSFLESLDEPGAESWMDSVVDNELSDLLNNMLIETLGISEANPPRDPETTAIIIDTLCMKSVPYTLQFLSQRLSRKIPKEFLPVPTEKLKQKFTEFWNIVPHQWVSTLDGRAECLSVDLQMMNVHLEGNFSKKWKEFIFETLPENQTSDLEQPYGPTMLSWKTLFNKYRKGDTKKLEERISRSNEIIIALAQTVTTQRE